MTTSRKESLTNLGLLALRVGLGLQLALYHGLDKFQHFAQRAHTFPDPLNIGPRNSLLASVTAELVCGITLALGLAGRLSALAIAGVLGVTTFMQRGHESWASRELSLLYFAGAVTLFFTGPGRLSFDGVVLPRLFKRGGGGSKMAAPKRPAAA